MGREEGAAHDVPVGLGPGLLDQDFHPERRALGLDFEQLGARQFRYGEGYAPCGYIDHGWLRDAPVMVFDGNGNTENGGCERSASVLLRAFSDRAPFRSEQQERSAGRLGDCCRPLEMRPDSRFHQRARTKGLTARPHQSLTPMSTALPWD